MHRPKIAIQIYPIKLHNYAGHFTFDKEHDYPLDSGIALDGFLVEVDLSLDIRSQKHSTDTDKKDYPLKRSPFWHLLSRRHLSLQVLPIRALRHTGRFFR